MIVIKNKLIPFEGYKCINLYGLLFTKSDLSDEDKNHEGIHSVLILEMGIITSILLLLFILIFNISFWWILVSMSTFYIWYGLEYLIIRIFGHKDSLNDRYHEVSLEEEAYVNDLDLNYLKNRKYFAWIKYIKINSYEETDS